MNFFKGVTSIKRFVFYVLKVLRTSLHDGIFFYRNSLCSGLNSENKYLGAIALKAHVVEKGITMPNRRYNFGEENLLDLICLCNEYIECHYNTQRTQFKAAISVIFEYEHIHIENNKDIPMRLSNAIENLHKTFPQYSINPQIAIDKHIMFQKGDFKYIAEHRHSIRHFCGTIPLEKVKAAIKLAQTAPSACNRQPIHVHIVDKTDNEHLFHKILDLQKGNRGFGPNADKLLIVTSIADVYIGLPERNLMYIDGGIFTMNLLYALHYYEIAACTLSASLLPPSFSKDILGVQETPIAIIAVGDCPDSFLVARSEKKHIDSIIQYH